MRRTAGLLALSAVTAFSGYLLVMTTIVVIKLWTHR